MKVVFKNNKLRENSSIKCGESLTDLYDIQKFYKYLSDSIQLNRKSIRYSRFPFDTFFLE